MYLPDLASIQTHTHTLHLSSGSKADPLNPEVNTRPLFHTNPSRSDAQNAHKHMLTCLSCWMFACSCFYRKVYRFTSIALFPRTDVEIVQETQLCQSVFLSNYHRFVDKLGKREAGSDLLLCVMHLAAMLTM